MDAIDLFSDEEGDLMEEVESSMDRGVIV